MVQDCDPGFVQEAIDRGMFKMVGPAAQWVPDIAQIVFTALEIAQVRDAPPDHSLLPCPAACEGYYLASGSWDARCALP
jgi:hypothetical protein